MKIPIRPNAPHAISQRMRWLIAIAASSCLTAMLPAAAAAQGHLAGALDPALATVAAATPSKSVDVIIQFEPTVTEPQALAIVHSSGGSEIVKLPLIHGLASEMKASAARALGESAAVRAVSLNGPVQSQVYSTSATGIPAVAQMDTAFDQSVSANEVWGQATGTGVGVAVIDSGVDGNLPDFASSPTNSTSRVIASAVINPAATDANDPYGHGTDVAELIAGDGADRPLSDPLFGEYAGTAPNANIIAIKIGDESGNATVLDAIYGIQFAIDHASTYNIRVINLSLSSESAQSYLTDPLDAAVEAAWFDGIVVVAAAGNLGNAPGAVQYSPANDPYVITVGATDDHATDELDLQSLQQADQQKEQALEQSNQQNQQALQAANQQKEQALEQSNQQKQQTLQQQTQAAVSAIVQPFRGGTTAIAQYEAAVQAAQSAGQAALTALEQTDQQALQAMQQADQQALTALEQSDQQALQAMQQADSAAQAAIYVPPQSVVAPFSSVGVTQNGFTKPDVYAPGAHIISLLAPGSAFASLCATCIVSGQYFQASGTSFAAPMVAGIVADLLQAHPTWTPDMVKGAIVHTEGSLQGSAAGVANAESAINASSWDLTSDQGLTPNSQMSSIFATASNVDTAAANASWAASIWTVAPSNLAASWIPTFRASWTCSCGTTTGTAATSVAPTRSSWSRSTWSVFWNY